MRGRVKKLRNLGISELIGVGKSSIQKSRVDQGVKIKGVSQEVKDKGVTESKVKNQEGIV